MKRALLLAFLALFVLVAFLIERSILLTLPADSPVNPALHALFQDVTTIALLIIALVLFALLLYSREIIRIFRHLQNAALDRDTEENRTEILALSRRFELTEQALRDFNKAMQVYAGHLASHTSAIQGLSQASQALRISAAEHNRVLGHLSKSMVGERINRKTPAMGRLIDEIEEKTVRALRTYDSIKHGTPEYIVDEIPVKKPVTSPPGCIVSPRALQARLRQ